MGKTHRYPGERRLTGGIKGASTFSTEVICDACDIIMEAGEIKGHVNDTGHMAYSAISLRPHKAVPA